MTEALFWDLVARVGVPTALVVVALLSGKAGIWRWAREIAAMETAYEKRLVELRAEMDARLEEVRARLVESGRDRDFYRAALFEALARADKSLDISARAVSTLERGH